MQSIWQMEDFPPLKKPEPLRGTHRTDVAVIGAGLAGVLTAYQLQQRGARVVLLDRGRLGGGVTGGTTAKITSQHRLIYDRLISGFGEEKAAQYAQANQRAIRQYETLIREKGIDCGFQRCPAYVYARDDAQNLEKEETAAVRLGIPASLTGRTELPFSVAGALCFPEQAKFDPLRFLHALAAELTVYEHLPAWVIEGNTVVFHGGRLRAKAVVIATHYPIVNTPGYYFLRMHQQRSYVLALKDTPAIEGMYLDEAEEGLSFRQAGDYLLVGGAGHRTGKNTEGGNYGRLIREAAALYPQATVRTMWSVQDCITADGVPFIGEYAPSAPRVFVATGFNKWGMTGSMVAATLLTDRITGVENPCAPVFSPRRFPVRASLKTVAADSAQAVAGLGGQILHTPRRTLDDLVPGQGGIVTHDGKKVGAYKDETGKVYLVSTRCPHLGCELQWNPEEKTWDCPCHGSRFDYRGRLLDTPARKGNVNRRAARANGIIRNK